MKPKDCCCGKATTGQGHAPEPMLEPWTTILILGPQRQDHIHRKHLDFPVGLAPQSPINFQIAASRYMLETNYYFYQTLHTNCIAVMYLVSGNSGNQSLDGVACSKILLERPFLYFGHIYRADANTILRKSSLIILLY